MKKFITNYKYGWLVSFLLMIMAYSCAKQDDYKKFIEGGEISYTGKLDSVQISSGRNRVVVNGLFIADPKIVKTVIYWNSNNDSVEIAVKRTSEVDTLKHTINNLPEGVYNFVIYTIDDVGNRSIPVYATGRTYGEGYQTSITNRGINTAYTDEAGVTNIEFGGMDRLSGVFATDLTYTDINDVLRSIRIPIDSVNRVLEGFKEKTDIRYRTLFLPDTSSVDTFYSAYTTLYIPKFSRVDVTATYLKNTGAPIRYSSINSANRWGILADWESNAAIRNASGFGGYETRGGVGVISMEAGWGLPEVTNGKIYQTVTLPAGSYRFQIAMTEFNTGGSRFIVAAEGAGLPNAADVTSTSIGFANLESRILNFTIEEETTVSIGFVCTLPNTGQYAKIPSVRLYSIQYL